MSVFHQYPTPITPTTSISTCDTSQSSDSLTYEGIANRYLLVNSASTNLSMSMDDTSQSSQLSTHNKSLHIKVAKEDNKYIQVPIAIPSTKVTKHMYIYAYDYCCNQYGISNTKHMTSTSVNTCINDLSDINKNISKIAAEPKNNKYKYVKVAMDNTYLQKESRVAVAVTVAIYT